MFNDRINTKIKDSKQFNKALKNFGVVESNKNSDIECNIDPTVLNSSFLKNNNAKVDEDLISDEVKASWKKDLFGGNDGAFKASEQSHLGIIKHVYQDRTEDEIKKEITDVFPDAKCDFFKNDDGFMGIIKIKFKTEQQFEAAKQNKIKIFEQIYHVEKYKSKRRVIRCMNCQRFGHIQRLCRQENPICAKCTSEDHETRDCVVLEAEYKCHHCGGNHETGNKRCQVMIDKLEELTNA